MVVIKPLYGIAEAGTHWWATYSTHHREKLQMTTSTYDPCLLISTAKTRSFGIVAMQIDDTLILGDSAFSELENKEMVFKAKEKLKLSNNSPISFNGSILELSGSIIKLVQKEKALKIVPVDTETPERAKKYVKQRVRGAYIASICQPEATFDLSLFVRTPTPYIVALRQMYERREFWEIRWINGNDNPADSMTKINSNKSLERFLDTNQLEIDVQGWVKR
ncbi:hypothetical protein K3495_g1267 [Podosphaera aphanis]|nr:hypothetical protein K3495_g1267 [Podosphaera aphanis]